MPASSAGLDGRETLRAGRPGSAADDGDQDALGGLDDVKGVFGHRRGEAWAEVMKGVP